MLGRHLLGYLPVQLTQALVGFGSVAVFTRLLGADEYGFYALVMACLSLVHMLVFTWLDAALARFHARAERRGRLSDHLATAYGIYGLLALFALVCGTGLLLIPGLDPRLQTAGVFALASLLLRALLQIGLETHRAGADIPRYSALQASYQLLGFMIGVGLLLGTPLGAAGIFAGTALAGAIMLVFDLPVMWRRARSGKRQSVRGQAYLKYGLPVSVSLVFEHLLSIGDRFLLAALMGPSAVGMYAAGYGLADRMIDIIFIWFGAAVWPLTIKALETRGEQAAKTVAGQAAALMGLIAFPAAAGLALVAPALTTVMVGESVREGATLIMPLIALSGLMNGMMTYYFHEAFTLKRRTGLMAGTMAAAAVFNLGLNLVLIPLMGLVGAALATVIAYGVALVVCAVLGRNFFALPLPWSEWIKSAAATVLMGAAVLAIPALGTAWILLFLQAGTGLVVYGAAALVFDIAGCRSWLGQWRSDRPGRSPEETPDGCA
ncbi:lipopolysaccharide biosynthesis protein [Maricaulis sp. D1M11]|uniref:lipopolysaccharide biosynthesis protein n=1 Tax=Maricaulis sp. D1M11 TaxID=3076117 RepID=UPI0039B63630